MGIWGSAKPLVINRLGAGGIITNYNCSSRCAHCLYRCGPRRDKEYIDTDTLRKNIEKIISLGCNSVHVGGGEPFLNIAGLTRVLAVAR